MASRGIQIFSCRAEVSLANELNEDEILIPRRQIMLCLLRMNIDETSNFYEIDVSGFYSFQKHRKQRSD